MASSVLPRRDGEARARLREVASRSRPVTLAREQTLPVGAPLDEVLPPGALQRGTVVVVEGSRGAGATSLAFGLAAAVTAAGEWAAAVDLGDSLGMEAAAEAGIALERFPLVRRVPPERWAATVAALLDGITLVVAEVPRRARIADARRLVARARERGAVLVGLPVPGARWPGDAALRLVAEGGSWSGLTSGAGVLTDRTLRVGVAGRGAPARPRHRELAQAG